MTDHLLNNITNEFLAYLIKFQKPNEHDFSDFWNLFYESLHYAKDVKMYLKERDKNEPDGTK